MQRAVPYYQRQDSRRWKLAAWLLSSAAVAGLAWLLLASPVMSVRNVEVAGLQHTDRSLVDAAIDDQLDRRWLLVFSRRATLLAPTQAIQRALLALPTVKAAEVSRRVPGTLSIHVVERIASVVWETNGQRYEVDLEGRAIRPLGPADQTPEVASLPRVVDSTNATATVGVAVASPELISLAIQAAPGPQGRGSDFSSTGPGTNELYVHLGDVRVLVTANQPLDEQYRSARGVMASLHRDELQRLDTVDVRLPELATYKLR